MEHKQIVDRCNNLKAKWTTRTRKVEDWYDIITLKDELAQDGMESVTSNDPRTGYNLGRHLILTAIRSHKIDQEGLNQREIASTSYLEQFMGKRWSEHETRYRKMGRQGFLWSVVSWLLATGWYQVFSIVEDDKIWSECWSPMETFPDYDEYGLSEVAHIYTVSAGTFRRKARMLGWPVPPVLKPTVTIYDHWGFDDDGDVANSIATSSNYLKEPTKDESLSKVHRLPVFVSPVGGLPDHGTIPSLGSNKWQEHFGESIVATNEQLTLNYNKMLTYTQQLVRDTANPRWFEQSNSEDGILKEQDLFKRGAIFRGAPTDSITPLPSPPIPVELRQAVMDYQNQLQRGLFPWSVFGNVQQQVSYLALASIAASSLSVLGPYVDALKGLMSDVENYWFQMMKENNLHPHSFSMPKSLPKEFEMETHIDIEIPGYLVQRATVSRMLNPDFKLPQSVVMSRMFPEVTNPLRAMAEVRKEQALNHPKVIIADTILAIEEQAKIMRDVGDDKGADLYEKLAESMKQEITGAPQPTQVGRVPPQMSREVLPTQEMMPPEETGMEGV